MKKAQYIAIVVLFLVVASVTSKDFFGDSNDNVGVATETIDTSILSVERAKNSASGKSVLGAEISQAKDGLPSSSAHLWHREISVSDCNDCEIRDKFRADQGFRAYDKFCSGFEIIEPESVSRSVSVGESEKYSSELHALTSIDSTFQNRPAIDNLEEWHKLPYFLKFKLLPVVIAEDDGSRPAEAYIFEDYLKAYMRQLFLDIEVLEPVQLNSSAARVPNENGSVHSIGRVPFGDPAHDEFLADLRANSLERYGKNVIFAYFIGGTVQKGERPFSAYGWGGGDVIIVRSSVPFYGISSCVIGHEIGHCFGLRHVDGPSGFVPVDQVNNNIMQPVGDTDHWRFERQRYASYPASQLEAVWYTAVRDRGFACDPNLDKPAFFLSKDYGGYRDITFIFPTTRNIDTEVQASSNLIDWETRCVCSSEWGAPIILRWSESEHSNYFRLRR